MLLFLYPKMFCFIPCLYLILNFTEFQCLRFLDVSKQMRKKKKKLIKHRWCLRIWSDNTKVAG